MQENTISLELFKSLLKSVLVSTEVFPECSGHFSNIIPAILRVIHSNYFFHARNKVFVSATNITDRTSFNPLDFDGGMCLFYGQNGR